MTKRRALVTFLTLLLLLLIATIGREPLLRLYYRVDHQSAILLEARRHDISPHLVAAVIFTESRFRQSSHSDAGARGLMQLMPETAAEMAVKEGLLDYSPSMIDRPDINIRLGSAYLAELQGRFSNLDEALAAYNAGPTVVLNWRNQGTGIAFEETRAYIDNVKRHQAALQELYPEWESESR